MQDINEIASLLHIEEKTRAHPHLKNLWDAAMNRLKQINEQHVVLSDEPETEEEVEVQHDDNQNQNVNLTDRRV